MQPENRALHKAFDLFDKDRQEAFNQYCIVAELLKKLQKDVSHEQKVATKIDEQVFSTRIETIKKQLEDSQLLKVLTIEEVAHFYKIITSYVMKGNMPVKSNAHIAFYNKLEKFGLMMKRRTANSPRRFGPKVSAIIGTVLLTEEEKEIYWEIDRRLKTHQSCAAIEIADWLEKSKCWVDARIQKIELKGYIEKIKLKGFKNSYILLIEPRELDEPLEETSVVVHERTEKAVLYSYSTRSQELAVAAGDDQRSGREMGIPTFRR